jgi:ribosomal protein S18 acetylase RimI-like enzyme
MRIRNAEPTDAGAIARIHVDGWRHAYRGILPESYLQGLSYSKREVNWSKWLSENTMSVLVAEDNGSVIGYVAGAKEGELGKLLGLYLNPSFIGKGIGKALLVQLEAVMKPSKLLLMVLKGNTLGTSFYERNGFGFTGRTEQLQIDGQSFVELEMQKEMV